MRAFCIVAVILTLVAVLSLVRINIVINFAYNAEDNKIFIKYLWFKKYLVPADKKEKKEEESVKKDAEKIAVNERINYIRQIYAAIKDDVFDLLKYCIKHAFTVRNLNVSAVIGTGDPMYTGIAYGSACGVIYNLIRVLDNNIKLKNHNVNIQADFDNAVLKGGIYTVIHTNLIHGGIMGIKVARIVIKLIRRNKDGRK